MTNNEFAASLRELADFYEAHDDMIQPWDTLWAYCLTREQFLKAVFVLSRGGEVTKKADDIGAICAEYHAMRTFGGITLDVKINRKTVCRLVTPAVYDCPDSLLEEAAEYTGVA